MGILAIASTILSLVSPLLPSIIKLVQGAHPVPPDAAPAVKADLNNLKASGANALASVLVNQFATAGSLPVSAADPSVQAMLAGAIEQAYQAMKAQGQFLPRAEDGTPRPTMDPQAHVSASDGFPVPSGKWNVVLERL